MKWFWNHPWVCAACNLLLVMAAYTLSRLFFFITSPDLFPDVTAAHLWEMLLGGVRFDLTAILYLSSVYLLLALFPLPMNWRQNSVYQSVAKWFFLVPNLIGIAANCADTVYVRFTDRRTTITFFDEFQNDGNLLSVFLQGAAQYWYVTLFALLLMAAVVWLYRPSFGLTDRGADRPLHGKTAGAVGYYVFEILLFVVSVYFIVIGIRGGFGKYTRPITLSNALQYTDRPQETLLVLNTPFSIMRSTEGSTYTEPHYFAEDEVAQIMTPWHGEKSEGRDQKSDVRDQKVNVVVFILESFAAEHIGFYNDGVGYTPFLDSLLAQSVTWPYSFASGRKSIDAMPSVLSSIPMLIDPYVVTPYSTNAVSSIADCLGKEGYTTAFFHGAPNGSMGFQAYARSAGFDRYYGMDEYPDAKRDFDGTWAIWDEEFLQFYSRKMSELPQPFMTAVFTASSHDPFRLPERYEGQFPEGESPLQRCVAYSDNALRLFFRQASSQPWFANTLFVITADHTSQQIDPFYTTSLGNYCVPVILYAPADTTLRGYDEEKIIQQADIMPTLLGLLHYDRPYVAFGQDVLHTPAPQTFALHWLPESSGYEYVRGNYLLQFDGRQTTAAYRFRTDSLLHDNILATMPPDTLTLLEEQMKSVIQQYMQRMTQDRLIPGR